MNHDIRDAKNEDFGRITEIYNQVLSSTSAIFRDEPITLQDALSMWRARLESSYPTLVCCDQMRVVGYASFAAFRPWPGYRYTVEHSVHVAEEKRGDGVGTALMHELFIRASILGKHVMVGGIDAENTNSIRFHERLGFERVGHLKEVGFKSNRYLDLIFIQRFIAVGTDFEQKNQS